MGETNTTAVILKEKEVLCSSEVPTTQDVTSGIIEAIELVLKQFTDELKYKTDNISSNTNVCILSRLLPGSLVSEPKPCG
mgnify:FL=1